MSGAIIGLFKDNLSGLCHYLPFIWVGAGTRRVCFLENILIGHTLIKRKLIMEKKNKVIKSTEGMYLVFIGLFLVLVSPSWHSVQNDLSIRTFKSIDAKLNHIEKSSLKNGLIEGASKSEFKVLFDKYNVFVHDYRVNYTLGFPVMSYAASLLGVTAGFLYVLLGIRRIKFSGRPIILFRWAMLILFLFFLLTMMFMFRTSYINTEAIKMATTISSYVNLRENIYMPADLTIYKSSILQFLYNTAPIKLVIIAIIIIYVVTPYGFIFYSKIKK